MERRRVHIAVDPAFRQWLKVVAAKKNIDMAELSKLLAEDESIFNIEKIDPKHEKKNIYW